MKNSSYNHWLSDKDEQHELSTLLEGLFKFLNAGFIQLTCDSAEFWKFKTAYTFMQYGNLPAQFSEQNRLFAEQFINESQIQRYNKSQMPAKGIENFFTGEIPFKHFIFLPLSLAEKPFGVISIYFYEDELLPTASSLEYVSKEWCYILSRSFECSLYSKNVKVSSQFITFNHKLIDVSCRQQLANVLDNQLKPLLDYSQSTIFLLDKETHYLNNFFAEVRLSMSYSFCDSLQLRATLNEQVSEDSMNCPLRYIQEFDDVIQTNRIFPFLQPEHRTKFKDGFLFNLYNGGEIIGNWIILYENRDLDCYPEFDMLQLVVNQITMAIVNILTLEKLSKCEEKSELVPVLAAEFSAIKNKKSLGNIINNKLRKLFPSSHHIVCTINEDDLTVNCFLNKIEANTQNTPKHKEIELIEFPIMDGILNKVLLSKEPIIFDLDQLTMRAALPRYLQTVYESGTKMVTISILQIRSKTIGFWIIGNQGSQLMTASQIDLIKCIAIPFSIAVDNIKTNEAFCNKELETAELLKLSINFARVRSADDLHSLLYEDLVHIVKYQELVITLLNNRETYRNFLFVSSDATSNKILSRRYEGEFQLADTHMESILGCEGMTVLDMKSLVEDNTSPQYIHDEYNRGIKEKIGILLYSDGEIIGVLFINELQKGAISEHVLKLFLSLAPQLSVVISNILTMEKTTKQIKEHDILLSLSESFSAIRNNNDLLQLISKELKSIINFRHTYIASYNQEDQTMKALLLDPNSASKDHPRYLDITSQKKHINDGFADRAFASNEPVIFNLHALAKQQDLPDYLQMNYENGISHIIITRLTISERVIGFWMILFDQQIHIHTACPNLIRKLANQISSSLLNIAFNDRINQWEIEKTMLIEFSDAIASVRDKLTLTKVLKEQLVKVFGISEFLFFLLSEDKASYSVYLFDSDSDIVKNEVFEHLIKDDNDIHNGVVDIILASGQFEVFQITDLEKSEVLRPFFNITKLTGLKQMIGKTVCMGDDIVGVITLWHKDSGVLTNQVKLWKAICSQLATAVSNIMTNEKVTVQLEEINKFKSGLEEEKVYLLEEIATSHDYSEIIGESPEIRKTFRLVTQVAASDSTVLILGETGTGKELIARAIHNNSPRKNMPMVKVNCAALPANLIESELFGHEKGSFTGATERRLGKFELANGGTLFLDEIGEMPLELQVKLLRVLQEKEVERIGGKTPVKIDVRIIAATNRNLEKEMGKGRFRSDLYYRLNIFPIHLPALRERKKDIPILATYFINKFSKKTGKQIVTLCNAALRELKEYNWPGNIREMEHLIERSVLLTTGDTLKNIDLPTAIPHHHDLELITEAFIPKTIDENERQHILNTLKYCNGKISGQTGASAILGIPASTLSSKIRRLEIKKEHFCV